MDTEAERRAALVQAVRHLEDKGLNQGSTGNLSCRDGDHILITPTGSTTRTLTKSGIVAIDVTGRPLQGGIPSSEWRMHLAIMEAFPAAQAIVHTHADSCVALSCLRRSLPPFHYMLAKFGGDDVRCSRYAPFGSEALSRSAVDALRDRTACFLANHGMVVFDRSIERAVGAAIALETLSRQYLLAVQAGEPVLLSGSEMTEVRERYAHYGHSSIAEA